MLLVLLALLARVVAEGCRWHADACVLVLVLVAVLVVVAVLVAVLVVVAVAVLVVLVVVVVVGGTPTPVMTSHMRHNGCNVGDICRQHER